MTASIFISFLGFTNIEITAVLLAVIFSLLIGYLYFSRRNRQKLNLFLLNSLAQEQDHHIVFFDLDSKIIFANKSFEELIGLPLKTFIGKKLNKLGLPYDLISAFTDKNEEIKSWESSSIMYTASVERNGKPEWFQVQKRRINLKGDKADYILAVASNSSQKKLFEDRLSVTQNEYRQLVESAKDIIFKVDLKGNFNFVNSIVKEILGYSVAEFLSMSFQELVLERDFESVNSFYEKQVKENVPNTYLEFRVKTKSGHIKWLGQSVSFIKDSDKIVGFQSVTRDITAAKDTEKHLEKAKEIAEETSKTKSGFIASMSHEFRTPLNAILGYTQILESSTDLSPLEKEHIRAISEGGEQLLGMVTDILELSTIDSDSPKSDKEFIALKPFMQDFANRFSKAAKEKGLEFNFKATPNLPEVLKFDSDKVTSIIKNILNNAIKFTKQGSVTLSYKVEESDSGNILAIKIQDTGIGIPKNLLEQVFLPFWQFDNLKNDGTGLGLTLCQRLVDFLKGEIKVTSKVGVGTAFIVTIPVKVSKDKNQTVSNRFSGSLSDQINQAENPIRVLIVDDLMPNRTITRIILKEKGYVYQEAENGQEALDLLEGFSPDVILMDINMPVMDGLEAMLTIRASNGKFSKIPIIAVTAGGVKGDKSELMDQGFSNYILKPFKADELLISINELVKKSRESNTNKKTAEVNQEVVPEQVADFILGLEEVLKEKISTAVKFQDFDAVSTILKEDSLADKKDDPSFVKLMAVAQDFDYLYCTKIFKQLNEQQAKG